MKKKVVFIGAGGYAKSVLDSLDLSRYEFCGFIDNFKPEGTSHLGYPILAKTIDDFQEREHINVTLLTSLIKQRSYLTTLL